MTVAWNKYSVQMIRGRGRLNALCHMAAAVGRGMLYGNITVSL